MNLILIYIILALALIALIFGWFYSPRTRKLAKFATLIIVAGSLLFGILALVRVIWFPIPADVVIIETPAASPGARIDDLSLDTHLKEGTVNQLFEVAEGFRSQEDGQEVIVFHCTIIEGRFCWFAGEDLGGGLSERISTDLAGMIVDQVDPGVIDQARGNELLLHCMRDVGSQGPITCEGNWGWKDGWIAIQVR